MEGGGQDLQCRLVAIDELKAVAGVQDVFYGFARQAARLRAEDQVLL